MLVAGQIAISMSIVFVVLGQGSLAENNRRGCASMANQNRGGMYAQVYADSSLTSVPPLIT